MALLHLLKGAQSISSLRDRNAAAAMATTAIVHLLRPITFCWLRPEANEASLLIISRTGPDGLWLSNADKIGGTERIDPGDLYQRYPEMRKAIDSRYAFSAPLANGHFRVVLPFFALTDKLDSVLVAECREPLNEEQQDGIFCFLHFYANYLSLLDYGELDALTGLHNRKTFDETLEYLLTHQPTSAEQADKREASAADPCWLAVLDIDRFKHINDTWGHLFGDETLLRFSRILKQTFRNEDRLFRFGGEEFIAIIRARDRDSAWLSFERFRTRLEAAEFPQVGSITCSIGFTLLDPARSASDTIGCADQALYFAKANGRNLTCSYEMLVEKHLIEIHEPVEGGSAVDFDIDALFT